MLARADKSKLERTGLVASRLVGIHAQTAAYSAYRRGNDPGEAAGRIITSELTPLVLGALTAGHVSGARRSRMEIPSDRLTIAAARDVISLADNSAFESVVSAMQRRADLTNSDIRAIKKKYGGQAAKVCDTFKAHVNHKLANVMAELTGDGAHIREGKKRLAEAFNALGMSPRNSFTLEGIFRTQSSIAYSSGRWAAEQDPVIQDILWGYRYVTVGDGRVRPEHAGFDGVTLPKDDPEWLSIMPPNGWACRCEAIAVFEERETTRPSPVDVDGRDVTPTVDKGFAVNFGVAIGAAA
jgi:SPP1 gp7 family putative phage head morphogenesis protein